MGQIEANRLSKESFVRSVNLFIFGFEMYANKKAPRSIGLLYELLSYACTVPIVPYFEEYLFVQRKLYFNIDQFFK